MEVVVDVSGGGQHQLAGAHGAHFMTGQGGDIQRVPDGIQINQLLDNYLGKLIR